MKIIISPAKKMNIDTDSLDIKGTPVFLEKTKILKSLLSSMSYDELKALWKCNDKIAGLNKARLDVMELDKNLTPAILAYEGIQYQYMGPNVFTYDEFDYIQEHLVILSGFYGVLRPFDGVAPYRLEMQTALSGDGFRSLYDFWGDSIAKALCDGNDTIINLASKEYSKAVTDHISDDIRFITCRFGELINGKITEKGTLCKMARGDMVRFMAENKTENAEHIKDYNRMGYKYSEKYSKENEYVFLKLNC